MKGTVFKYGAQGDPFVRPQSGGKIVVLTDCEDRPEIGTEVDYTVTIQGRSVVYATLQQTSQKIHRERPEITRVEENPLERSLNEIQALWDKSFAEHMTEKSKVAFLQSLQDIRDKYQRGDYAGAAQIAHKNYEEALRRSDFCEMTDREFAGPGFAYFPMFQAFESLEESIRKSA